MSTASSRCYGAAAGRIYPSLHRASRWSPVMTKPKVKTVNDLSRCLDPLDMDATVIAVIEMSQSSWLVAGIVPGVERQPLKKLAIDEHALLKLLSRWRAEAEKKGHRITRITVAFEAGHDGFWLARCAGHREPRHSCVERRGDARTPPGEERSARHRASEARLSRLAARRARALQDGRGADACRGGRQAAEPGSRDAGWRGEPDYHSGQGGIRPARHSQLQPEAEGGRRAPRGLTHARG